MREVVASSQLASIGGASTATKPAPNILMSAERTRSGFVRPHSCEHHGEVSRDAREVSRRCPFSLLSAAPANCVPKPATTADLIRVERLERLDLRAVAPMIHLSWGWRS